MVAVLEVILHNIPVITVEENYTKPGTGLVLARVGNAVVAANQHWCAYEPAMAHPDFVEWERELAEGDDL